MLILKKKCNVKFVKLKVNANSLENFQILSRTMGKCKSKKKFQHFTTIYAKNAILILNYW